jgi:putative ABC transport system permease protein
MRLLSYAKSFFRFLLHRQRIDADLDDEVRSTVELLAEEKIKSGMPRDEALRAARIEVGGVEQVEEEVRSRRAGAWLDTLLQDLRFGLRTLRKSPGFTAVAIITLALGMGTNTAIFSVVNYVLLRPLPFKNPSSLVLLHEGFPSLGLSHLGFSPPDLTVFMRAQKSFKAISTFLNERVDISGQSEPDRVTVTRVSASLFPMLGEQPMLGRNFAPEEDAPGHPVAILSYRLWQSRYGGASDILGQRLELDRQPYTIIGVMPRNFVFPLAGLEHNSTPAEVWVPMAFTPDELQAWGNSYMPSVVARLRPGVSLEQARAEAQSLTPAILASYPSFTHIGNVLRGGGLDISAFPFQEEVVGSVRTLLLVLMAAVSFVLLIACANIATLLLSRAANRQKEIAVRSALGATRFRLIRQLLTESLLLAFAASAVGLLIAVWARNLMLSLAPSSIPVPHHISLSVSVFAFALGVSIFAAVLFDLAPAFQVSFASIQGSLQESGRSATTSRSRHRLQGIFVTAEFALALVLLTGSGLLIRSFAKLLETNPGFRPDHILTVNVPLPRQAYAKGAQIREVYGGLLDRVSRLPGVQSAALSNDLPLDGCGETVAYSFEGRTQVEGKTPKAICQSFVKGSYFQTMGIPLLQGRWFTPEDRVGSEQVAVVNLSMAQKFWPGQSAIGKRIIWGEAHPNPAHPWETIIGVVGNVKEESLNTPATPQVYRPYSQLPDPFLGVDPLGDWHAMSVVVRTHRDPTSLASVVVAQVHFLDPDLAVTSIRSMTQVISSSVAGPKFNTFLVALFAALALILAAIGIYGVLAYTVTQQSHEIGIRMALGAQQRDVMRLILKRGARLALLGVAIGAAGAVLLTHLMASLLYGISPTDPVTLCSVTIVLVGVALLACYIPARRAMRVDPMQALRHE